MSDLIFSPRSVPHVEVRGQLVPVKIPRLQVLAPEDTRRLSDELIGSNKQTIATLQELDPATYHTAFQASVVLA
jgi:hypothetical protein